MTAQTATFQDNRPYISKAYLMPSGRVVTYRWHRDEAEAKMKLLPAGAVEVAHPFRKGAPIGGYCLAECQPTHGVSL